MRLWLNFVVMVALAVMVGVSLNANQQALERAQREAFLDQHPEISPPVWQAILGGRLREGMSPQQVKVAWGKPQVTIPVEGQPQLELWQYPRGLVRFESGAVVAWETVERDYETGADLARRALYVLSHKGLDERLSAIIRQGAITVAMTPEQVRASWGRPDQVIPVKSETLGELEVWVYPRGQGKKVTVTFQQGRVLSWSELPSSSAKAP